MKHLSDGRVYFGRLLGGGSMSSHSKRQPLPRVQRALRGLGGVCVVNCHNIPDDVRVEAQDEIDRPDKREHVDPLLE
jgi:hypothetical protein